MVTSSAIVEPPYPNLAHIFRVWQIFIQMLTIIIIVVSSSRPTTFQGTEAEIQLPLKGFPDSIISSLNWTG